jgi:hypothetical protein
VSWSTNNIAHRMTWIFARSLHPDSAFKNDKLTTFTEGGEWNTRFIIDSAPGASDAERQNRADIFARKFNAWITIEKEAIFEENHSLSSAIQKLTDVFSPATAKLKNCGDAVDEIYRCKGEAV